MKITALSAILTTLLTLSIAPNSVLGASSRRRCLARPGHGSGSSGSSVSYTTVVTTSTPAPSPAPPKESEPAPAPAPPAPSPTHKSNPAPAPPSNPSPPKSSPPSSGGGTGNPSTSTSDEQTYLSAHNSIRSTHGAVSLTWNNTLAAYAQQVANTCVFEHSGGPYGENLSAGTHSFSIASAIKLWTDEEKDFNPGNPVPSHYTQVVWKGSKQVGCAKTTCATLVDAFDNADYYVCEYYPAGNVIGEFPENVEK